MATGDAQVQSAVHAVDQGRGAIVIKAAMFVTLVLVLLLYYLFFQFKGLDNPSAMEQAQIARNLASGQGFTTDSISPAALAIHMRLTKQTDEVSVSRFPEMFQMPLNPFINSFSLRLIKKHWQLKPSDPLPYAGDRVVAATSMIFFLMAVGIWFLVLSQLFDSRLALFACGMTLLTDLLWQFSLSALPQMLVLFLFAVTILLTLFAMEAHQREQTGLMIGWLIGAGVCLGLMTLAHGLAFWLLLGWLIFAGLYFRPRGLAALAALAAYGLVVTPWLVRNAQVSGNPFGLAIYEAFYGNSPENDYLRKSEIKLSGTGTSLKGKARTQILNQAKNIAAYLGLNVVAGAFFLALFHPFRSRRTAILRWCLLAMWLSAALGMAFYPPRGEVSANQFHVLFIPIFIGYGLAFLFVLWNRLELGSPVLRVGFITLLFVLCAIPMTFRIFSNDASRVVRWPPYLPPYYGILAHWFNEDETICSDMPWAIAWYGQRYSLLLPETVTAFNRIHDYNIVKQRVKGLYLTPLTGDKRLYSDIYAGPLREWAGLITRPPQLRGFPLPAFAALPIEGQCGIFADYDRWNRARSAEE